MQTFNQGGGLTEHGEGRKRGIEIDPSIWVIPSVIIAIGLCGIINNRINNDTQAINPVSSISTPNSPTPDSPFSPVLPENSTLAPPTGERYLLNQDPGDNFTDKYGVAWQCKAIGQVFPHNSFRVYLSFNEINYATNEHLVMIKVEEGFEAIYTSNLYDPIYYQMEVHDKACVHK